jgi:hypothetical protein
MLGAEADDVANGRFVTGDYRALHDQDIGVVEQLEQIGSDADA